MDNKADQYFPTYKFLPESRDALLIEFAEAQKIANSQTKIYGQVANILLAITTF
jgi:penicillin-binding protein 1A